MPSTRSQAGVGTPAGEAAEVAEALEEAAAELSAEIAARRAAEARVQALQAQLAAEGGGDAFATPGGGAEEAQEEEEEEPLAEEEAAGEGEGEEGDGAASVASSRDGEEGEPPAGEEHRTADEILSAYLSPDPAVRASVSAEEVTWAKDAKATAKLLAPEAAQPVSDHSALFAAVQAQNASLLKLFEESAKRESLLADRLAKLEKEGDSEAEKEAQNREFVDPFAENDYYAGAAEHLIRKAGSEPSFEKRNWSHIAAVKSLEETQTRLEGQGKLLTAEGIAASTSLEHLLTLSNLGADLENISLAIAAIGGEHFAELNQQASKGERNFCEKPTNSNYESICKLYNHVLALQENIVRPRLSLVVLQHRISELCRGKAGGEVAKYIKAYKAAEVAVFGEPLTEDLPDFFSDVIKGVVDKSLQAHRKATSKSLSGQTRSSDGRFISNFSRAAVGRFGATARSWNVARGAAARPQAGAARPAAAGGALALRR